MARRKMIKYLIKRENIKEEMRKIEGSLNDYITPSGKVFTDYGNNNFYPKTIYLMKNNGYLYCNINYDDKNYNGPKTKRVHILVAKAFINNLNNYPIVMHLDNNKQNCSVENLKWGTV